MARLTSRAAFLLSASIAALLATSPLLARDVAVTVKPDTVVNSINPLVYGHFYEHIYHSANNGLWGEVVWNRSFEQPNEGAMGPPTWTTLRDMNVHTGDNQSRILGAFEYRDFDYTVDVRKTDGDAGLRLFFRSKGGNVAALTLGHNGQHMVERVAGGGGRRGGPPATGPSGTPLAEPVPGTLTNNQWHKVRLRMEDRRLQAWLDDKQIFDFEPPAGNGAGMVPAQGYIGLGTLGAKAEFRNLLVKGLDGTVFWKGPLPTLVPNSIVEKWSLTGGTGRVLREPGQALNDQVCLELTGTAASPVVLSQPAFYLRANDPQLGSLWLKGNAPAGATVEFVDDAGTVLSSNKVEGVTSEWKEFPLNLVSAKEAEASLRITVPGDSTVLIDQVSLMPKSAKDNGGFRPDLYEAFAGLQPTTLRWPGGCFAETYVWKNGIGPQKDRKKSLRPWWEEFDPNALGTDEYIQLCRKMGAEPLLVPKTGMHLSANNNNPEAWAPFVQDACDWLEYCNGPVTSKWGAERAKNGHPKPYNVKLWEIDNELWRSRITSPQVYAEAVKVFSAALKKVDPSITIIAHGGNGGSIEGRTGMPYNRPIIDMAGETFSIFSIHHYTDAPQFVRGITDQDRLYQAVIDHIKQSKNPDMKIYVSEWNAQTTDWRTGIYAGGLLNVFEKHGAYITMAGPALMGRHVSAHDWDNAFVNFNNKEWFAGPNYVVMKLWREHFAPQRVDSANPDQGLNLIATKTETGDQVILKAVNLTSEPLDVNATLDGAFKPARTTMQLINPGSLQARNSMHAKDVIKPVTAPATVQGNAVKFTLPPYSTAAVRVFK